MPTKILTNFLRENCPDSNLQKIISAIARAGKFVAHAIRTGDLGAAGT